VSGLELNLGGSTVSAALVDVYGVTKGALREMYRRHGDLGDVAQVRPCCSYSRAHGWGVLLRACACSHVTHVSPPLGTSTTPPQACRRKQTLLQAHAPLTISGVFSSLHRLACMSGQGAAARRQAVVGKLLRAARDVETRYLVRMLISCLRVGAGYRSVLPPLARAALLHHSMLRLAAGGAAGTGDPAAAAAACAASSVSRTSKAALAAAGAAVTAAFHRCPNIQLIADVLRVEGPDALDRAVQLVTGVPVKPMLARPCTGAADALSMLQATAANGTAAAASGGRKAGRGRASGATRLPASTAAAAAAEGAGDDGAGGGGASAGSGSEQEEDASSAESDAGEEPPPASRVAAAAGSSPRTTPPPAAAAAAAAAGSGSSAAAAGGAGSSSAGVSLSLVAEYKYDGQRAQIHATADAQVHIFSRNCEEHTAFPDVAAALLAALDHSQLPLVLDAELVAVDRAHGNRLRAFQELATRRRTGAGAGAGSPAGAAAASGGAASRGGKQQQQQHKGAQQKLVLAPDSSLQAGSSASAAAPSADAGEQQPSSSAQQPVPAPAAAGPAAGGADDSTAVSAEQQQQQQAAVAAASHGVDVCVFVFDCLCVGGRDLMGCSLRQRRAAAAAALPHLTPGVVQLAEGVELSVAGAAPAAAGSGPGGAARCGSSGGAGGSSDWAAAEQQLMESFFAALDAGCEGLMLKLLDGPGGRHVWCGVRCATTHSAGGAGRALRGWLNRWQVGRARARACTAALACQAATLLRCRCHRAAVPRSLVLPACCAWPVVAQAEARLPGGPG
jgi:ATP-dependent DNA ligase